MPGKMIHKGLAAAREGMLSLKRRSALRRSMGRQATDLVGMPLDRLLEERDAVWRSYLGNKQRIDADIISRSMPMVFRAKNREGERFLRQHARIGGFRVFGPVEQEIALMRLNPRPGLTVVAREIPFISEMKKELGYFNDFFRKNRMKRKLVSFVTTPEGTVMKVMLERKRGWMSQTTECVTCMGLFSRDTITFRKGEIFINRESKMLV